MDSGKVLHMNKEEQNTRPKFVLTQKHFFLIFCLQFITVIVTAIIVNRAYVYTNNKITKLQSHNNKLSKQIFNLQAKFTDTVNEDVVFLKIKILNSKISNNTAKEIARHVYHYAKVYDRDPDLMLALIKIESNFNTKAVSSAGAEGLTQIMPFWKEIFRTDENFFDIETSVKYSFQILAYYEHHYGELEMALIAYNRGHNSIEHSLAKGKDPRNGYAAKVNKVWNTLQEMKIN